MPDWAPPKIKQICERAWNDDMYTRPTLDEIANELLIGTGRLVERIRKPDVQRHLIS